MIEKDLEKRVFSNAASMVTVSQPLSEQLSLLHKNNNIYTIPNGFDPDIQPSIEFDNVFSILMFARTH
jgi:hypothetical protein